MSLHYLTYRSVRTMIDWLPAGLQPYALDLLDKSGWFAPYYGSDLKRDM